MAGRDDLPMDDDSLLRRINTAIDEEARRLGAAVETLDMYFLVFLRETSRFGYFAYGPVVIDVRLIEEIVRRTTPRGETEHPAWSDDLVRFSRLLMDEVRRSGASRIDDLHFLLAFMRAHEGLPGRVFAELGVTPGQVEQFARDQRRRQDVVLEPLYSPEEAAAYLGIHVQTVRSWIRSGRLRARRLAGQRALRITASDLESVLEPLDGSEVAGGEER